MSEKFVGKIRRKNLFFIHTIGIRYLLRLFDCLAHPSLSATFATDQKWPLCHLRTSYQSLAGSLSSFQKSEFLKLIFLIFHLKKLNNYYSIWSNLTIFLTVFSETSRLHNGQKTIPKFLSGFKHFYYKKSCRGIKFLFNWKNLPWFSGAYNDWIGLQDFHAFSDLRSTQSVMTITSSLRFLYILGGSGPRFAMYRAPLSWPRQL